MPSAIPHKTTHRLKHGSMLGYAPQHFGMNLREPGTSISE
jgi:hypothetical protein